MYTHIRTYIYTYIHTFICIYIYIYIYFNEPLLSRMQRHNMLRQEAVHMLNEQTKSYRTKLG